MARATFVGGPVGARGGAGRVSNRVWDEGPTAAAQGSNLTPTGLKPAQLPPDRPQPWPNQAQPGPNSTQTCPNSDAIRLIRPNFTVSQAHRLCMIAPSFNCKIEERLMAKRPTNNGASWSAGELRTLKQLAKAGTAQAAAKQLGRTPAAVQQKAMRTGISFRAAPAGRGRAAKKK
jgi:hypothetical protein